MGDLTHDGEQIGTARLVRLLTAIGAPAAPGAMVRRTLGEIAEVLRSDVVCVAERVGDRLRLTEAVGIPGDDDGFIRGWSLGPLAAEVIDTATPMARDRMGRPDAPESLPDRVNCSAAWIPLGSHATADLLLVVRDGLNPFPPTDV